MIIGWLAKNKLLFFLAIAFFCLGIALSFDLKSGISLGNPYKQYFLIGVRDFPSSPFKTLDGNQNDLKTFLYILTKNSAVGAVLGIGGLLSAGIITAVLMVWNGYLFGIIMNIVLSQRLAIYRIAFTLLTYGPLEIFAMAWLGAIGLRGSFILRDFLQKNTINKNLIPSPWEIGLPFIFLGIAAFFETAVIHYLEL